jgi:hypothetical protein
VSSASMNRDRKDTVPSPPQRGKGCRRQERGWFMVPMRGKFVVEALP